MTIKFTDGDDCQICLSELHKEENLHQCYQCHKYYHMDCIKVWKEKAMNPTCPNCRIDIIFGSNKITSKATKLKKIIENK